MKASWWDSQWEKPAEFLKWIDRIAEQWQRILKPNGSLYCFASPRMAARVEVTLGDRFQVLNRITWQKPPHSTKAEMFVKEDLRCFFPASESIIFCEQFGSDRSAMDGAGYEQKCGELHQKIFARAFGDYLDAEIKRAGVSRKSIAALFPSASGGITGCVSNWILGNNCPSKQQYETIRDYLNSLGSGDYLRQEYEDLRQEYEDLRQEYEDLRQEYEDLRQEYEDLRRPFSVSADVPYTDVWTFPTVQAYPGKHECQKPAALLEHIIMASSRPGDVVLDCFAGSGSTLAAAKKLGRKPIGIEIDPNWVAISKQRLGQFEAVPSMSDRLAWLETQVAVQSRQIKKMNSKLQQLDLFGGEEHSA